MFYVIVLLPNALQRTVANMSSLEQTSNGQRVEQAIKKLWSSETAVRERGHQELLQIGPVASGPLVTLLADLIENPHPRFDSERGEVGQKALEEYIDLIRCKKEPVDNSNAYLMVFRLAINGRLMSDVISLLGDLKAAEGVPILIHIMENMETGVSEGWGIEMEALFKIGSPAVPNLIRSIENANRTASTAIFQRPITLGFSFMIGAEDDEENSKDDEEAKGPDDEMALDPDEKAEIERKALRIKNKAIRVLGEIGDKNALPYLESLTKTIDNLPLVPSVLAAIREIRNEPPTRAGPMLRRR